MLKMIVLIALVVLLSVTYLNMNLEDGLNEGAEITFYTKDYVFLEGANYRKSGIGYEITVDIANAHKARSRLHGVMGESIVIDGDIALAYEILNKYNAKTVKTQEIADLVIIYGYSRRLRGYVMSDNSKINIEIAISKDNKLIVGTPIIIGSY